MSPASEPRSDKVPRAILFDWDNTLVDNWPSIHEALNATFARFDKPQWTLAETKARVRRSLRDSFPDIFGAAWEDARDFFYRRFDECHLATLRELPGAGSLLAALAADGIYLGVVSNKNGDALRREASHLGWTGHFARLVGAGDAAQDKPAPAPVRLALAAGSIQPGPEVWFVGDAGIDMQCAHACGCTAVLISKAKENSQEFQDFPPQLLFPDLAGLGARLRPL